MKTINSYQLHVELEKFNTMVDFILDTTIANHHILMSASAVTLIKNLFHCSGLVSCRLCHIKHDVLMNCWQDWSHLVGFIDLFSILQWQKSINAAGCEYRAWIMWIRKMRLMHICSSVYCRYLYAALGTFNQNYPLPQTQCFRSVSRRK